MVTVEEVRDRRAWRAFVQFPYDLYARDALWVPYLRAEVKYLLGRKNPFWLHAQRALFLARRRREVVGRIAAIKDD